MEPTWWFIPNWNSPRSHYCLMKSLITSLTWGGYWEMSICNSLEHPSNSVLQFIDTDAAITSNILHVFLICKTYIILHKNVYDTTFMLICFVFKKVKIRYWLEGSSRSLLLSGLWPLSSQYVVLVVILTSFTRSITSFNHTTNCNEKSSDAWAYFYWNCCWLPSRMFHSVAFLLLIPETKWWLWQQAIFSFTEPRCPPQQLQIERYWRSVLWNTLHFYRLHVILLKICMTKGVKKN